MSRAHRLGAQSTHFLGFHSNKVSCDSVGVGAPLPQGQGLQCMK